VDFFFDVKGDLERFCWPRRRALRGGPIGLPPGRLCRIFVAAMADRWIGELHPRLQHK